MKLVEFISQGPQEEKDKFAYDVAEDLYVYMKNDPAFYRQELFPILSQLSDKAKMKKEVDLGKEINPCIEKAKVAYIKKFKIPKQPSEVFTDDDNRVIVQRMSDDELETIKKGGY